jgi:hypothetical protein
MPKARCGSAVAMQHSQSPGLEARKNLVIKLIRSQPRKLKFRALHRLTAKRAGARAAWLRRWRSVRSCRSGQLTDHYEFNSNPRRFYAGYASKIPSNHPSN